MELRKGFKESEAGMIPKDWKEVKLSEITSLMTNGFVGTATLFYSENDSDVLYIQGYNVEENGFNFNGIKYVTKAFHKRHMKSNLREGDLLTIQTGECGLTTIVPKELAGSNCHALIISRFREEETDPKFFSYYFNSFPGRSRLRTIETGTTMKHINVGDMLRFMVPLPPLKAEQTAIATALGDMDTLISSLKKIIEKKSNIKQGIMQRLLNPEEKTVVKKIGDIITRKPKTMHQSSFGLALGNYPFFTNSSSEAIDKYLNTYDFDEEAIIANTGGVAHFKYHKGKFAVMSDCFVFSTKENANYLFYFLKSIEGFVNENYFVGSGIKHLDKRYFEEIKIPLPLLDEQNKTVQILTDMDSEINHLEKKLYKYKMIRQGMMQELLTGKIRLV